MKKETKRKLKIIGFTGIITPPVLLYLIFSCAFIRCGIEGIGSRNWDAAVIGIGGGFTFLLFLGISVYICIKTEYDIRQFEKRREQQSTCSKSMADSQ